MHLVRVKSCARVVYQPFNNHTTSNREVRRNALLHFCVAQVFRSYVIYSNSQLTLSRPAAHIGDIANFEFVNTGLEFLRTNIG